MDTLQVVLINLSIDMNIYWQQKPHSCAHGLRFFKAHTFIYSEVVVLYLHGKTSFIYTKM